MPNIANTQISEAKEAYLTLLELSKLLNTGLDAETLTICVKLIEAGVNPEALANVIRELRSEMANLQRNGDSNQNN